jgi:hypothetical protein
MTLRIAPLKRWKNIALGANRIFRSISVMAEERFDVSHVEALTRAFRAQQVDFLIMGKGAAIIELDLGRTHSLSFSSNS